MPARLRSAARFTAMGLLLCLVFTGCTQRPSFMSEEQVESLAGLRYPEDAAQGPDLDILASRKLGTLTLKNFTPHTYERVELWVNRQYVQLVDKIEIGQGNTFDLTKSINLYREPYPVGGYLRPDKTAKLILVEIYDPAAKVRYKLTTQTPNR